MKAVILLLLLSQSMYASNERELFSKASLFYHNNNVEKASELFGLLAPASTRALTNLAICHFELNKKPEALAALLAAQQRGSFTESRTATQTLDLFAQKTGKPVCVPWYQKVWGGCPLMLLVVQLSFLGSWYTIVWHRRRRKRVFVVVVAALICLVSGVFVATAFFTHRLERAVVTTKSAVYVGPCQEYHSKGMVEELDIVALCGHKDGWYKIKQNNNEYGWISDSVAIKV